MRRVVIDTNVLVSALHGGGGMSRTIVRACLADTLQPVFGAALLAEYEDVFSRDHMWVAAKTSKPEREIVLNAFLSKCDWIEVFFAWRPNLPDEADNHLIELALSAQATTIITKNLRDLKRSELKFSSLQIMTPKEFWENYLCQR
jgi:putative PIN family toxin of toxin-antitoxin system